MANKTIDQLTANSTLAGTELLPLYQSSATVKLDLAELRLYVRKTAIVEAAAGRALVVGDAGTMIKSTSGALPDFTLPVDTFAAEDVIYILNASSNPLTLTPDMGVTLYLSPSGGTTGARTIPARGVATIYFTTANEAYCNGVSVT